MTATHHLIQVERTPGWLRCLIQEKEDQRWVNVFPPKPGKSGTLYLFSDAGYADLFHSLAEGQKMRFNRHPIAVELKRNGDFWNVVAVDPRPDGAGPDPVVVPQGWMYRDELIQWAQLLLERRFVVWDAEGTGLQVFFDEIIQMGWIDYTPPEYSRDSYFGKTLSMNPTIVQQSLRFEGSTFIRPSDLGLLDQPNGAAATHGITAEMLEDADDFPRALDTGLRDLLHLRTWVGYNITIYDAPLIEHLCARFGQPPVLPLITIDLLPQVARYIGVWNAETERWRSWKLVEAAEILGVATDGAHDALGDCRMTLGIVKAMAAGVEPDQRVIARFSEKEVAT